MLTYRYRSCIADCTEYAETILRDGAVDTLRELRASCKRLEEISSTKPGWKWHFAATITDSAWANHIKHVVGVPTDIEHVILTVGDRIFTAQFLTEPGRQKEFHLISKKVKGSFIVVDGATAITSTTDHWVPRAEDLLAVFSACVVVDGSKALADALGSLVQKGKDFKCTHNSNSLRGEAFTGIGWGTWRNPQTSAGNWAAYKLNKYARIETDMIGGVVKEELLPLLGDAAYRTLHGANLPSDFYIGGLPGHKLHTTLNAQVKPHYDKRDLSGTIIFWHHHASPDVRVEDTTHSSEGSFQLYSCFISALLGRSSKICYVASDVVLHGTYNHSIDGLYRFGSAVYCGKADMTRYHRQLCSTVLKGVCHLEWEDAERFERGGDSSRHAEAATTLRVLKV